ncbi:MAG: hypothetical protein A2075_12080 [Geobacteraceae bacterium GWC2_58_44]|nr:MAG: hypothetical protein A2075_12080 [Geobacteraceae bacterium GWC2_58_44]HBG06300.1 hypothetical protein [Geobacter sp.]
MPKQSTTLTEIREHILEDLVKEIGMPRAEANSIAFCVVGTIRKKWGGCEGIYIPNSDQLEERDWKMWEMFNGSNYDEVGQAFELTGRQVRNRIRIIRPIAEKRDQAGLFDSYLAEAG